MVVQPLADERHAELTLSGFNSRSVLPGAEKQCDTNLATTPVQREIVLCLAPELLCRLPLVGPVSRVGRTFGLAGLLASLHACSREDRVLTLYKNGSCEITQ